MWTPTRPGNGEGSTDREETRAGTRNSPTNEHLIRSTGVLSMAGLLATDSICADRERGEPVSAVRAGARTAGGAGGVERRGDRGVGNRGSRGIEYEALYGSLAECRARKEHECCEPTH